MLDGTTIAALEAELESLTTDIESVNSDIEDNASDLETLRTEYDTQVALNSEERLGYEQQLSVLELRKDWIEHLIESYSEE